MGIEKIYYPIQIKREKIIIYISKNSSNSKNGITMFLLCPEFQMHIFRWLFFVIFQDEKLDFLFHMGYRKIYNFFPMKLKMQENQSIKSPIC